MRGKKTAINTVAALLQEFVKILCGFILPRIILTKFGSDYNGLTTSITQFLAVAVLFRSGVGGATRAALYKPIADGDQKEFSAIIKATDIYMKKIALLLGVFIILFAFIYPLLVNSDFTWLFVFSLFIIIGFSSFAESFFGITYLIVLQATQRLWISSLLHSICYIMNLVIAMLLIYGGASIHLVKLGSALVYVLYPVVIGIVVRKMYRIDKNVEPNNQAIAQRWDAFWHQVSVFVMSNSPVIILTAFCNIIEVSVYSIYNLVISSLKSLIYCFTSGLEAAFGNMIAKNETKILNQNVSVVEFFLFNITTIVYTTAASMILSFVMIYTTGITDVDYYRPEYAYIILLAQFFSCFRYPYQIVVQAAGHYKQTRNGAMIEPMINIVVSVICVIQFGIIGVAIGMLCATVFRTIQYSIYASKHILQRSIAVVMGKLVYCLAQVVIVLFLLNCLPIAEPANYLDWAVLGVISVSIATAVALLFAVVFSRNDLQLFVVKCKNIVRRRKA